MDQREHLRIQIPLGVEISHPALGTVKSTARDISQGGVFIRLKDARMKVGAKLKVRIDNLLDTDTQHTPTVEMEVKRVTDDGLGLAFINHTAQHLWTSVQRLRDELQVGRDYFQVHQSAVVHCLAKGILLVEQDGKWLLPGHYLIVGEMNEIALRQYLKNHYGLECNEPASPIIADSAPDISVLEAATFRIIYKLKVGSDVVTLSENSPARNFRWVSKPRDLKEVTFAAEIQREAAEQVLSTLELVPSKK